MDHHVRLWSGTRLWILICPAGDITVRRLTPVDVAAVFQRGCRTWTNPGADSAHPRPRTSFPLRRRRTYGNDYSLRDRRPHRVALDGGTGRNAAAVQVRMAGVDGDRNAGSRPLDDRRF